MTSGSSIGLNDVLCGRGGATNNHPGNQRFRAIVAEHMPEYLQARKKEKAWIARRVVQIIQREGGRFLKRKPQTSGPIVWIEVTDKKATEKTSQALREGLDVRHKTYRPEKLFAGARLMGRPGAITAADSGDDSSYQENPRTRTRLVEGTVLDVVPSTPTSSSSGAKRVLHRIPKNDSGDEDLQSSCTSSLPDLQNEFFMPSRPGMSPGGDVDPLQVFFEPPRITRADCDDIAAV